MKLWSSLVRSMVAGMLLVACGSDDEPQPIAGSTSASTEATAPGKPRERQARGHRSPAAVTYDQRLAELDGSIARALRLTEKNRGALGFDRAALLTMRRADLTGSFDDLDRAEVLVGSAFGRFLPDVGPYGTRAQLELRLGRLGDAEAYFERHRRQLGKGRREQAEDLAFAAELALLRGRYAEAEAGYRDALALDETSEVLGRLGVLCWKTGAFDEGERLVRRALARVPAGAVEAVAELHVVLGRMDLDRGRYAEALDHLREAQRSLPDYWRVEQHLAEVLALRGEPRAAEALYVEILARGERPELLDALAELHRLRGDEQGAESLAARAHRASEAQLARHPHAAYEHALAHCLAHDDDRERTLRMAEEHHAMQPDAEAKALLARAQLATGDHERAEATIEQALATPWSTIELHLDAAEIFGATGNAKRAAEELARADAINPRLATALEAALPWEPTAFE